MGLNQGGEGGMGEDIGNREGENGERISSEEGRNMDQQARVGRRNRKKRSLKWATLNAQSLNNKMDLLRDRVDAYDPQILSVTESFGLEGMDAYTLKDYTMYRDDRVGRKGAGTILYIKSDIEQRVCRALSNHEFENSA